MTDNKVYRDKKRRKRAAGVGIPLIIPALIATAVIVIIVVLTVKTLSGKKQNETGNFAQMTEEGTVSQGAETSGDFAENGSEENTTSADIETTEAATTEEVTEAFDITVCGMTFSSDCTEIDISGHEVTDIAALYDALYMFSALTYVDMCDCGLSNEQMEDLITAFPQIKFVWKVTLGLWTIRTDTVAFSTLKDGTITYRLTNEDCKVLKYCTDMVALDLGHNKVTDLSFLQYMPELKILILVDNWLTDTQSPYLYDLSMLKYCPKLMYLEFFVGDVSDISVFEYLPELVDLNISYNPITDVTPLLNLPKIERLYLEHTGLTEADYELLKETYPDAYIVYYGEGSVDQGWRTHERYYAMIDMFHNNYVHELFMDKE